MAGNTLVTMLGRASAWIRDHLLASYLVTAACILLMADAIRGVLPDDGHTGVITWVAIGLMAYAGVAMLIFVKRYPDNRGIFVAWGMGASPAFYGFAAGLSGSPAAVLWLGVAWSLTLVAFVAISSGRRPETGADST
jgi:hypothetical protein